VSYGSDFLFQSLVNLIATVETQNAGMHIAESPANSEVVVSSVIVVFLILLTPDLVIVGKSISIVSFLIINDNNHYGHFNVFFILCPRLGAE